MADHEALHRHARGRGVNPLVYWIVRGMIQPVFHLYFRLSRIGREHIPDGPVLYAANHRSFLDPFVIGTISRRPIYYVAKKELFGGDRLVHRLQAWFLSSLGAFPVDRGGGDTSMIDTAKAILARGDSVLIFPEGTRVRSGPLGATKRGVGRLAIEAGVPVVPVAVIGSENARRGWRIRPAKVRIRVGRPLTFPAVEASSPRLAAAVTERIWACVALQWEWLGGTPPVRRVAVLGPAEWGGAILGALTRAGVEPAPLAEADLVCLAVAPARLAATLETEASTIAPGATLLLDGAALAAAGGRVRHPALRARTATLGGPADLPGALRGGEPIVVSATDAAVARRVARALATDGRRATTALTPAPRVWEAPVIALAERTRAA